MVDVVVLAAAAEEVLGADSQEATIAVALERAVGIGDVLAWMCVRVFCVAVDPDPDLGPTP